MLTLNYSCQSTSAPEFNKDIIYRYDMRLEINKRKGIGFMVAPRADKYKIKIKAKGSIDMLVFRNCHRDVIKETAYKANGLFKGKKYAELELSLSNPIEFEYCPIFITAFDKDGHHTFGMIDIEDPKLELVAKHNCNGETFAKKGVSGCIAFNKTYQEVNLPERSRIYATTPACELSADISDFFRYEIKKGICTYIIEGKDTKRRHRMSTIGYERITLKE